MGGKGREGREKMGREKREREGDWEHAPIGIFESRRLCDVSVVVVKNSSS